MTILRRCKRDTWIFWLETVSLEGNPYWILNVSWIHTVSEVRWAIIRDGCIRRYCYAAYEVESFQQFPYGVAPIYDNVKYANRSQFWKIITCWLYDICRKSNEVLALVVGLKKLIFHKELCMVLNLHIVRELVKGLSVSL